MSAILDRYAELTAALRGQPGYRLQSLGDRLDPPAVILRPASLTWTTRGPEPDEASLQLAAVVAAEVGALLAAARLCQRVVDRVDPLLGFVVRSAEPDSIRSGGTELPCYLIDIEVSL